MLSNRSIVTAALFSLLLAAPVYAQGEGPVSRLLPDLMITAAQLGHGSPQADQSKIFLPGVQQLLTPAEINRALALQLTMFPDGPTASAAFSPPDKSAAEGKASFGSGFGDRGLTIGHGRMGFTLAYQTTDFAFLDKLDVRDSALNLYITQGSENLADPLKRDLLLETLSVKLNRKTVSFVFNYGLTDRFDVGLVVPVVQMAADARITSQILRTATVATPGVHFFDDPIGCGVSDDAPGCLGVDLANKTVYASATARGIGDVVVRAKYGLLKSDSSAVAVVVDARLPTGNADDFIGLGVAQVTPSVVWSMHGGRVAPRASAGYTLSNGTLTSQLGVAGSTAPAVDQSVPDQVTFSAGLDAGIGGPLTFVADVTGRRVSGVQQFTSGTTVFPSRGPGSLASAASFTALDNLILGGTRVANLVLGTAGLRLVLGRSAAANASVLFPIGHDGLRPTSAKGVFWLDYGF